MVTEALLIKCINGIGGQGDAVLGEGGVASPGGEDV